MGGIYQATMSSCYGVRACLHFCTYRYQDLGSFHKDSQQNNKRGGAPGTALSGLPPARFLYHDMDSRLSTSWLLLWYLNVYMMMMNVRSNKQNLR